MHDSWIREPYRLFFPLGALYLLWGILLWLPLIWTPDEYPVLAHRYLVLNGFMGSFIAGFLMTAVPKFSKTSSAKTFEVLLFGSVTLTGVFFAYRGEEKAALFVSALQPLIILSFLFSRITKRKENPPYSFVFIFVGLLLWLGSALSGIFIDLEALKNLHYEGAMASIILGVGSRLIPGILGHVEVVALQREKYEKTLPILSTVPKHFLGLIIAFVGSYFLSESVGDYLRAFVVGFIALKYWWLFKLPQIKTALTWSLWLSGWLIVLSFFLKALWPDGMIHASHSFFINGIVLLSLLVSIRVLQSHGPGNNELENRKLIYVITFLVILAAATRVSAYLMPALYLTHLGYSSFVLTLAIIVWGFGYLRYIFIFNKSHP